MAGIDEFTKLILHVDSDFSDSSSGNHSPTVSGATIDTVEKKFGIGSAKFIESSSQNVKYSDHIDFIFDGDFTIDFWFRTTSVAGSTNHHLCSKQIVGNYSPWSIVRNGNQLLLFASSAGTSWDVALNQVVASSLIINTLYHFAYTKQADTYRSFLGGVLTSSFVNSDGLFDSGAPVSIGGITSGSFFDGNVDELRISKGIARWTENFTPPTEAYDTLPPPIEKITVDKYHVQGQPIKRRKPLTNPGDFDVAGLHIPVPIKMDRWQNLSQPPARRKKVNPANVGQFAFVDFTIPVLPEVLINQWQNTNWPRKSKPPRVLPAAFASSEIASINPVNGNYFDSGVIGFEITVVHTAEEQTYADRGVIGLTVTGVHTEDFQLEDTGVIGLTLTFPEQGVEAFNSGVPGFVSANVIIDGVNQSNFLQGVVSVSREDNAAARFNISLEHDPDLLIPKKPIEFINKIITINFAAADMDGMVSDYIPIFIGIIKSVSFNENKDTLRMTGYDYSGIHQTRGEYVSGNITDVLTGSIGAGSSGTINTGHSPIWGVIWNGSNAVKDGQDYFVDTKNGQVIIPISSRILQYPGHFTYNYANNFSSMKAIIQAVAGQKNWVIEEDGVTIADYTEEAAHPVLSLSDEAVIDTCRKFLELSGAKVEGNLFPKLRVYSEVENWTNPANVITFDESIIFENTLVFNIDFDNLLNEQTVRSVQRVNAEISIGAGESIAEFSTDSPSTNPFSVQVGVTWAWKLDLATPTVLAEHRISKQGLNSISLSSSGRFHLELWPWTWEESISGDSWKMFIDGDDFVLQLSHNVVVVGGGGVLLYAYPAFEYSLTVNGSKINYSGGSPEDVRVVTAQRPVGGITATLKGDVYENPYIETDTHCVNICNAVLLEHGNPYTAQFDIPVYQGKDSQIGNRVDIKRGGVVIFSGIIKNLNYTMNLDTGKNKITVIAKGIGKGI